MESPFRSAKFFSTAAKTGSAAKGIFFEYCLRARPPKTDQTILETYSSLAPTPPPSPSTRCSKNTVIRCNKNTRTILLLSPPHRPEYNKYSKRAAVFLDTQKHTQFAQLRTWTQQQTSTHCAQPFFWDTEISRTAATVREVRLGIRDIACSGNPQKVEKNQTDEVEHPHRCRSPNYDAAPTHRAWVSMPTGELTARW